MHSRATLILALSAAAVTKSSGEGRCLPFCADKPFSWELKCDESFVRCNGCAECEDPSSWPPVPEGGFPEEVGKCASWCSTKTNIAWEKKCLPQFIPCKACPECGALTPQPTPVPTPEPTPVEETKPLGNVVDGPPSDAACFPGDSTVTVQGQGRTSLHSLSVGDSLLVENQQYEQVLGVLHMSSPSATTANFHSVAASSV